jgi:hypothetical protein
MMRIKPDIHFILFTAMFVNVELLCRHGNIFSRPGFTVMGPRGVTEMWRTFQEQI